MASRPLRLALRGSRDVLVLALAGADWLHHDHQPHQRGARRQAVPRLVGSHGRQCNFRRTVGVALLVSTYRHVSGDEGKAVGTVPDSPQSAAASSRVSNLAARTAGAAVGRIGKNAEVSFAGKRQYKSSRDQI